MNKPGWKQRIKDIWGGSGDDKEEKDFERSMHKLGIDVLKDQKLDRRMKLLIQFEEAITTEIKTEDLNEYVQELKDRQELLNHAVYEISAPFGRAGDIPRFGKMFHGWGRLNASASSWILRTSDIVSKAQRKNNHTPKPEPKKEPAKPEAKADQKEGKTEKKTEETEEEVRSRTVEELMEQIETESIDPRSLVQNLHDVLQKHIWKDGFLILGQCFLDRDVSPRASTVIQNVNAQREREDMTRKPDFS